MNRAARWNLADDALLVYYHVSPAFAFLIPMKPQFQLWLPTVFSAVLSSLFIGPIILGSRAPVTPGLIPFFCFLPMAFFFVALTTHNYVSQLEKRVAMLERQLSEKAG